MTKETAEYLYELWQSAHGYGTSDPVLEKQNRDEFYFDLVKRLGEFQANVIDQLLG